MTRALFSVSDKTGLVPFARGLADLGVELVATGGTARALRDAGLAVRDVADVTGFPEMLGGRVKTLHPAIHAALLARRDRDDDMAALAAHGIAPIDLVVVNLYPFAATSADPACAAADVVEQIDIGGVALLRAAAKNADAVTVVSSPLDYDALLDELRRGSGVARATRLDLAARAFRLTASYDAAIAAWLAERADAAAHDAATDTAATDDAPRDESAAPPDPTPPPDARFPALLHVLAPRRALLRYGENPHQRAAFYVDPDDDETSLARARQLAGKQLSYNNLLDADAALLIARDLAPLAPAAAVIVKHANPCGIALGDSPHEAYLLARATDPDAAFGGIVALSATLDEATAVEIATTFNEVVIAPAFEPGAVDLLATSRRNLRLLETGPFTPPRATPLLRGIVGGWLLMERDEVDVGADELRVVSEARPTPDDLDAMRFAWRCVKWVKSNAIVYADRRATIGIGAGQMSRIDAARFGAMKARRELAGCAMASDAFFPFPDAVELAAQHGVRAIIQPGGSVRDAEVIAAADAHGIAMVFTGTRHFRH